MQIYLENDVGKDGEKLKCKLQSLNDTIIE